MEDIKREDRWLYKEDVNIYTIPAGAEYFDRWYTVSSRSGGQVWVPIIFEDGFLL